MMSLIEEWMCSMPHAENPQKAAGQSLLAHALASTASAILITDSSGEIVWINEAFSRLSGYQPDELLGRTPSILKSGKQSYAFYSELWQTILEGKVWQGEVVDQRKDGSLYTVDEIITPLFDQQGGITHFIAIQHDITQQKIDSEREHHLAYHDALTDLPNRLHFLGLQRQAISYARRTQHMIATLFLDLDRFKPVNDTLGHHVGDLLLSAVAERLRSAVRQADVVARFGGDEFAVLLTNLPDAGVAVTLTRKLLDILGQPYVLRGQRIDIGVSIGIAIYPTDGQDSETLLMNADKAMYQAKCRGGNNYQLYGEIGSRLH
jgi:diguanylate cyclase